MENILIHNYKIGAKGIKKTVVYHFSDVHLTEYDDLSDENEKQYAASRTVAWEGLRRSFAEEHNEPYSEEILLSARDYFSRLVAEADNGDAMVMTGDICDFTSGANLRAVESELKSLNHPFLNVIGNHENRDDVQSGHPFERSKAPVQLLELDDVIIFGIDNSSRNITEEQNEQLKKALLGEKPLIIAMHVPIMTEGNKNELEKCGEYFQLNNKDATKEVFEFIETIKQNASKIIAVLAGHLHFANNSEITPGVTQYVSSQGILGNINRYEIGE